MESKPRGNLLMRVAIIHLTQGPLFGTFRA